MHVFSVFSQMNHMLTICCREDDNVNGVSGPSRNRLNIGKPVPLSQQSGLDGTQPFKNYDAERRSPGFTGATIPPGRRTFPSLSSQTSSLGDFFLVVRCAREAFFSSRFAISADMRMTTASSEYETGGHPPASQFSTISRKYVEGGLPRRAARSFKMRPRFGGSLTFKTSIAFGFLGLPIVGPSIA